MPYSVVWNENTPTDTDYALGDDEFRALKTAIRERLGFQCRTVNSNSSLTLYDSVILCDCSSSAITVTLPSASGISGRIFRIVKIDSTLNTVTVLPYGSEKINNGSQYVIDQQYEGVSIVSDGSNWFVLSKYDTVKTVVFSYGGNAVVGQSVVPAFICPCSAIIVKAYAYAITAPQGSALIFDINKNGTTIWTNQDNRLRILAGSNSGSQTNFDVRTLSEGDVITLDIDQVGSTTP
ncbi:MAG: hypothetical protein QXT26_06580, partial [Thermoproteota archaeon]